MTGIPYMNEQHFLRSANNQRVARGSMLLLACAIGFLLVMGIVFAIMLGNMFVHRVHDQSLTEATTLRAAVMLNANDQIGRMNNLVVQSRELVFDSRAAENSTLSRAYWYLQPLAEHLREDARSGATLVDNARQKLIADQIKSLQELARSDPTLKERGAKITGMQVGDIAEASSNVYDDEANELQDFDEQQHWMDPKSRLFNGNISAPLPNEDGDLSFKISPLCPPRNGKMVQAAIINTSDFEPAATLIEDSKPKAASCEQIPSAVKIDYSFEDSLSKDYGHIDLRFSTAATTNGGQLAP
jgi:hypothetical protein